MKMHKIKRKIIFLLFCFFAISKSEILDGIVVVGNAQTTSSNIEELLEKAKRAINTGKYYIAIKYLDEYIKNSEKKGKPNPEVYLLMADIQSKRFKDYPIAVNFYKKYLQIANIEKIKGLEGIAKAYYDWGLLYDSFLNSSVNLHSNYYSFKLKKAYIMNEQEVNAIRYYRGLESYLYGRFDNAINDFTKVSDRSPHYNVLSRIKLAGCYYQKGQKQKANQIWSDIKKSSNGDILIESELIITQLESNIDSAKKEALKKRLEISELSNQQKNKKDYYNRIKLNFALISLLIGDFDNAYKQIEEYDPKIADISVEKAKFYQSYIYKLLAQLSFSKAKKYYEECIKIKPDSSDFYNYHIGICCLYIGKIDDAIKAFEKVSKKPLKQKAQIYLAICFYNKGQKQKAIEILDSLLKDKDKDIIGEVGYAYARIGIKLDEALKLTQKSNDHYKTAFVYFQLGLREKDDAKKNLAFLNAIRILDQYRGEADYSLDKNDPIVLVALANLYYHRNMFDESARVWMHFNSKYPHIYQIINRLQLVSESWQLNPKDKIYFDWVNQFVVK